MRNGQNIKAIQLDSFTFNKSIQQNELVDIASCGLLYICYCKAEKKFSYLWKIR